MRRFIATLTGKRDKHENKKRLDAKQPSRSAVLPPSPSLLQVHDPASLRGRSTTTHSACSSEQSTLSLPQTPDDDHRDSRTGWKSWMNRSKKNLLRDDSPVRSTRSTRDRERSAAAPPKPNQTAPPLPSPTAPQPTSPSMVPLPSSPATHTRKPSLPSIVSTDSESDSEDGSSESDDDAVTTPEFLSERPPIHPNDFQKARKAIHAFTVATLAPIPTASPFLLPSQPFFASFPRSMMSGPCQGRQQPRLFPTIAKKNLLSRLDTPTSCPSEQQSILPFAQPGRPIPETPSTRPDALPAYQRIRSDCPGLRQWADRPCYEERACMWSTDEDGKLIYRNIPGSGRAVAALEFSEGLEALVLAGSEYAVPVASIVVTESSPVSSPQGSRIAPQLTLDLPKSSISQTSFEPFPAPPSTSSSSSSPTPSPATPPATVSKRGVRFQQEVEEVDEDDLIPLGVTIKARREQEERERWLWAERERMEREAEARAAAEVARKRQFAEEIAATRRRREEQRGGFKPRGEGERPGSSDPSYKPRASRRPSYDPRSKSRPTSPTQPTPNTRPRTISRGSSGTQSRPTSYAGSVEDNVGFYAGSRASSSGSISGMTGSPSRSSFAGSTDDLRADRRSSTLYHPDSIPRSRKMSERSRNSAKRQSDVPQVPFLARNWDVPDVPLPPQNLMQQGPFMASVRSQKQSALRQTLSSDRVDSFGVMNQRPQHPRHNSENARPSSGGVPTPNLTFQAYDYRTSLYGTRPQMPHTLDTGRRGTMIF